MNTATALTIRTAEKLGPIDNGHSVTRAWTWYLTEHSYARIVHVRPVSRTARATWSASLVEYAPDAGDMDDPIVEEYSPLVSTQARALEWLNATVRQQYGA